MKLEKITEFSKVVIRDKDVILALAGTVACPIFDLFLDKNDNFNLFPLSAAFFVGTLILAKRVYSYYKKVERNYLINGSFTENNFRSKNTTSITRTYAQLNDLKYQFEKAYDLYYE